MGLKEYRGKRDFKATPEPEPGRTGEPAGGPRFVVHEHHARALHWDLRLEIGQGTGGAEGHVLASFAVPKGPSPDRKVRRLAIRTEDHPVEYLDFQGSIPQGQYGGGQMSVWDRGRWETEPPGQALEMLEKGHVTFRLEGERLQGRWHLIRTKPNPSGKEQWLLFKGRDKGNDEAGPPG